MVRLTSSAAGALLLASVATAAYNFDANGKTVAMPFYRKEHHAASPSSSRLAKRQGKTSSQTLSWGDLLYYINITIGTPGQDMAAWLDTGSSDLWVPDFGSDICETSEAGCSANGGFDPSKSSTYKTVKQDGFEISYASGDKIIGDYGTDTLKMDNAQLKNMQFGVAIRGKSGTPLSGIMGIGYTLGESVNSQSDLYPNIIDQLVSQNVISSKTYSLYLNDLENGYGTILFGGVDQAKYSGELGIVNVQSTPETGNFDTFSVVLTKMSFEAGGQSNDISVNGPLSVVLDSGTTLTYLPNDVANAIYDGLGITVDENNEPYVPCDVVTSNMHFSFTFGSDSGVTINVDLGQFVLPFDPGMGLPPSNGGRSCAFGLYPAGSVTQGQGDILFGDTFLRSAYVVYDLSNNQVAMAQTKFDVDKTNVVAINGQASGTTNTIPQATTVAHQVSAAASATNIGAGVAPTDLAGAGAGVTGDSGGGDGGGAPSPTFKGVPNGGLQSGTTEPINPTITHKKSAASPRVPPFDWKAAGVVGVTCVATMLGSGFFLFL